MVHQPASPEGDEPPSRGYPFGHLGPPNAGWAAALAGLAGRAYTRAPRPLRRGRRASHGGAPCLGLNPSRLFWYSSLNTSDAVNSTAGATTAMGGSRAPVVHRSVNPPM